MHFLLFGPGSSHIAEFGVSSLYFTNLKILSSVVVTELRVFLAVFSQMIELYLKSYTPIRINVTSPKGPFQITGYPLNSEALMTPGASVHQT